MTRRSRWAWRHLPLWLKAAIIVGVPALPLLFTATLYYESQRAHDRAQQWVVFTWEIRYRLQRVLTDMTTAESAVRAYLLTGDRKWLGPYERAAAELPAQMTALEAVADDIDLVADVRALHRLVDRRLELLALAAPPREVGPTAARSVEDLLRSGDELSQELGQMIAVLLDRQDVLLAQRLLSVEATRRSLSAKVYSVTAAGVLGGFFVAMLGARGIRRRLTRVESSAAQPGQAAPPVADDANDEIGRLSQTLTRAVRARENTEKDLRHAWLFVSSILDNIPESIFVKEASSLRYVWVNRAAEELMGRPRDAVLGRTAEDLFPPEQAERFNAADAHVLSGSGTVEVGEELVETPSGERILQTRKVPLRDGDGSPRHLVGISQDITQSRHDETTLRLARDEAERANRSKSEFLSRMSHDLRTPLNAVIGFAQTLELESDSLTPGQADSIQHILSGGRRLLNLVNEVLDIARIDAGELALSLEPVDAVETMQQVATLLQPLAAKSAITISVSQPAEAGAYVRADANRLKQAMLNLIENAVKYNNPGGTVEASAHPANGWLRLAVTDSGPGVPAEKRHRLFTPFERLGAEARGIEGTGLGLAVTRRLIEAMGGTMGFDSFEGQGSTFWLELPVATPLEAPAPQRQHPTPAVRSARSSARGTVLYVEDNPANTRLMERLITARPGVRLLVALDGSTGLKVARAEVPDLVLLDLHLPDMPGEEVLERMIADPAVAGIPVAILSADATPAHIERLLAAGAAAYITKPFAIPDVMAIIDRFVAAADLTPP